MPAMHRDEKTRRRSPHQVFQDIIEAQALGETPSITATQLEEAIEAEGYRFATDTVPRPR